MFEPSLDWKIGKKLIEAGGLGPRVYIWTPRAASRTVSYEQYLNYLFDRRQVVIMPANKPKGVQLQGIGLYNAIIDKDTLTPESYARAERIWKEYWNSVRQLKRKETK